VKAQFIMFSSVLGDLSVTGVLRFIMFSSVLGDLSVTGVLRL